MYNGIGLATARGSGTNGYVQRNLSHVRVRQQLPRYEPEKEGPPKIKKANKDILEHEGKRKIEVKLMEFRLALEDEGYDEEEIDRRVDEIREKLVANEVKVREVPTREKMSETHALAYAKELENEKFKRAFGIRTEHRVGEAFDRELQEQKKQERIAQREMREKGKARERGDFQSAPADDSKMVDYESTSGSSSSSSSSESSSESESDSEGSRSGSVSASPSSSGSEAERRSRRRSRSARNKTTSENRMRVEVARGRRSPRDESPPREVTRLRRSTSRVRASSESDTSPRKRRGDVLESEKRVRMSRARSGSRDRLDGMDTGRGRPNFRKEPRVVPTGDEAPIPSPAARRRRSLRRASRSRSPSPSPDTRRRRSIRRVSRSRSPSPSLSRSRSPRRSPPRRRFRSRSPSGSPRGRRSVSRDRDRRRRRSGSRSPVGRDRSYSPDRSRRFGGRRGRGRFGQRHSRSPRAAPRRRFQSREPSRSKSPVSPSRSRSRSPSPASRSISRDRRPASPS